MVLKDNSSCFMVIPNSYTVLEIQSGRYTWNTLTDFAMQSVFSRAYAMKLNRV